MSVTDTDRVRTISGEIITSVKDINIHIADGLSFGHSKILGKLPVFEGFDDPVTNPEVLDHPLYDQYRVCRYYFASSHVLRSLSKHQTKSQAHFDAAVALLDQLVIDYQNYVLSTGDIGGIATVHTEKGSYPSNPDTSYSVSSTVRYGVPTP